MLYSSQSACGACVCMCLQSSTSQAVAFLCMHAMVFVHYQYVVPGCKFWCHEFSCQCMLLCIWCPYAFQELHRCLITMLIIC